MASLYQVIYNKAKTARDEALAQLAVLQEQTRKDAEQLSLLQIERDRWLLDECTIKRQFQDQIDRAEEGRREAEKAAQQAKEEMEWEASRGRDALLELERVRRSTADFLRRVRGVLLGVEEGGEDLPESERMKQLLEQLKSIMALHAKELETR
jgi:hypothetical protein